MRKLNHHFFKIISLILLSGVSLYLFSEEDSREVSLDDEVLEVRTQFPRYRILYNHQKTIQEVQDELQSEESSKEESEKGK